METKRTDREMLSSGLQKMGLSLVMMFAGPTLFYVATTNKEKPLFIPLLILAILICLGAGFLAFRGLQIIMRSVFGKKSNSN